MLVAEGEKQAAILRADAAKQAAILLLRVENSLGGRGQSGDTLELGGNNNLGGLAVGGRAAGGRKKED